MRAKVLTITLNPAIDRLTRLDTLVPGRDQRGEAGLSLAGGKGINAARALRALGVSAMATGWCGGRMGDLCEALLTEEGLCHSFCRVSGETRVNATFVARGGAVTRVIEPGPVVTAAEQQAFLTALPEILKGRAAVLFCGSLPPGVSVRTFTRMLRLARRGTTLVAVDTSGPALKAALELGVDIIKPNRREAEEVLGRRLSSEAGVRKALEAFLGYGIKNVLISLGEDGLAASDGHESAWVRVPRVREGHGVGCGDAALAGFVAGRLEGKPFHACVDLAAACGVANLFAPVPGAISRKIVRQLGPKTP